MQAFASPKQKGMALPLTLVVLLVAGAIVAVSMYIIENMMMTTKMKTDGEILINAAISGLEKGKQWILEEIDDDRAPRLTSDDIENIRDLTSVDDIEDFLAMLKVHEEQSTIENVNVTLKIFDLDYPLSGDIDFLPGMPPLISLAFSVQMGQSSLVQRQSYDETNRGGGSPGTAFTINGEYRAYLIRSHAVLRDISKTVEQAVVMKK